ncbi:MAG: dephospho-CoA kinase [Proteobacteria bacterium]|nr:dephospho-CoA kinase [Pseudomonadota bacterium]
MLIIGLTGSIGMGKSTVAKRFLANGIAVCDADAEVHKLYAAGGAAVAPIEAAFPGVTGPSGVERPKLAAALLKDPSGFKRLEAIVHPLVHAAERAFLIAEKARGAAMTVLEIPLLLEGGGEKRVDVVVVVSAPAHVQRARVLERPGMTAEKADQIIGRQMPDAEKRAKAHFVIDTGVSIGETEAEVDDVVRQLKGRAATAFEAHWA